jgi:hypothetical protein
MLDPDRRIQDVIRTIFRLFERLGSARQVLLHLRQEGLTFPRPLDHTQPPRRIWRTPVYRSIFAVLRNPFYAGAYAFGKSQVRTTIVDGAIRKVHGLLRPMDAWLALVHDHHEAYISWPQFLQNQERLARNAFRKPAGDAKAGRGGLALLGGLLRCRRCGRMLQVTYGGRPPVGRYSCRTSKEVHGVPSCVRAGASRPDAASANEIPLAVQPVAIEAALVAEADTLRQLDERRRALELEHQQAAYEVTLAARRYETVDPDNRLVAAELEARWNGALTRLRECETRLASTETVPAPPISRDTLLGLADNLHLAWNAPTTDPRTKQRLVRALIEEIVLDIDDSTREIVLTIHWRGGQHSELRMHKPQTGEHSKRTPQEADQLIRSMATRWSDADIAATLNRLAIPTGVGNTWTPGRVTAYRHNTGIPASAAALGDGRYLTVLDAAKKLGTSRHIIRAMIHARLLPALQVVVRAHWQILATDLELPTVQQALRRRARRGRPCKNSGDKLTLTLPGT